jgi:hypothetical protein
MSEDESLPNKRVMCKNANCIFNKKMYVCSTDSNQLCCNRKANTIRLDEDGKCITGRTGAGYYTAVRMACHCEYEVELFTKFHCRPVPYMTREFHGMIYDWAYWSKHTLNSESVVRQTFKHMWE